MGDAVCVVDHCECVESLSPAAAVMTGWSSEEAAGRPLWEVAELKVPGTNDSIWWSETGRRPLELVVNRRGMLLSRRGMVWPVVVEAAPFHAGRTVGPTGYLVTFLLFGRKTTRPLQWSYS